MKELLVNHIRKYMGTSLILEDINFQVYEGERVGIVGVNGCGKSTIMKLIAGILELNIFQGSWSPGYDEGSIIIPKGATRAYLDQLPDYEGNESVMDILCEPFEEVYAIEKKMHELEHNMNVLEGRDLEIALKRYSALQNEFESKGGYEIDEKIKKVASGLKFSEDFLNKSFSVLSGGERTTVILGKLLIEKPDILLLDEPTNHLDMAAIEWLEEYLKGYRGIVIVVSHDRYFLDNVVTKIVEIEDKVCETYNGNYSKYVQLKDEAITKQYEDFKEQQKKIKSMEKAAQRLRDWSHGGDNVKFIKRAVSIERKLQKMEKIDNPEAGKTSMKLSVKAAERSGNITIKAEHLCKAFEDKTIFNDANMIVNYAERVALIGGNGCGKTTFVKMLLGEEEADSGVVTLGSSIRMAYLPQNFDFPDSDMTLVDWFRDDLMMPEGKAREYLSKFMFYGGSVYKRVNQLSGGERIRLKLSRLLYDDVNLLILDEPTNHLDIDSIETLEVALNNFKGTIFFISHDRYFINQICSRIVAVENQKFRVFDGDYDFYRAVKDEENLKESQAELARQKALAQEKEKARKVKKKAVKSEKKVDPQKFEAKVQELEGKIKDITAVMEDSGTEYTKLNELFEEREGLKAELDKAMEEWLKAQEE